jgi:hypothetical protein
MLVTVTIALAMATLSSITQMGSFLLAKESTVLIVTCCCHRCFCIRTSPMYTSLYTMPMEFEAIRGGIIIDIEEYNRMNISYSLKFAKMSPMVLFNIN